MMRRLLLAAAMLMAGAACTRSNASEADASGSGGQRNFAVGSFDRVSLAGSHDVRVAVGGAPSVRAEGDEADLERLEIKVVDGQLRIGTKPGSWSSRGRVIVYVTAPALQAAGVAGSGDMEVSALRASQFRADVAGSGNLVLQGLETESASFGIAGSGNLRAAGRSRSIDLRVAGSGAGQLDRFETESAKISVSGSGGARVRATGTAAVSIAGSGNVGVTGGARCTVRKAGSGELHCG